MPPSASPIRPTLGAQLRQRRNELGFSLRQVERQSGINSGYLSQIERNEVLNPTPSALHKLASAYDLPFGVLMHWAGYVEDDPDGISPNARRALSLLGDDLSDEELTALKAVLDVLRGQNRAFHIRPHRTDLPLSHEDVLHIHHQALAVLREVDGLREGPVDLSAVMTVANLVSVGAIELSSEERRSLRSRFGSLVDRVLGLIQGVVHLDARAVYVQPDLHELKRRFVMGHEAGHAVLQDHSVVFAHLDDHHRLAPDFADTLERQANQFSIELLTKGDRLRQEFDDSAPSMRLITRLSLDYQVSLQAVARRSVEESRRCVGLAIAHKARRSGGSLMPLKLYCSVSFEQRLRWLAGRAPVADIRGRVRMAADETFIPPLDVLEVGGRQIQVEAEGLDTPYATMVLFWIPARPGGFALVGPLTASPTTPPVSGLRPAG